MVQFLIQKVVDLVVGIAWPVVVLSIVWAFRNPLKGLISRINKAKFPGVELEATIEEATTDEIKSFGQKIIESTEISENDKKIIENKISDNFVKDLISESLKDILEVTLKVIHKDMAYNDAFKEVAIKKGVDPRTVRDSCTRRIGLNIEQFKEYLENPEEFKSYLSKQFPSQKDAIKKQFNL